MQIYQLIYHSKNTIYAHHDSQLNEIRQILETSRANNQRDKITGCLLFDLNFFMQILEGPKNDVYSRFRRIETDKRHTAVILAHYAGAPVRLFPKWSMAGSLRTHLQDRIYMKHGVSTPADVPNMSASEMRELCLEVMKFQIPIQAQTTV